MPAELPNRHRLQGWISPTVWALAIATLSTVLLGWTGLGAIQRLSRSSLASRLDSDVDVCEFSLRAWLDEQRKVAKSWAEEEGVRKAVTDFMNSQLLSEWDKDRVLASDELKQIRSRLKPVCDAHEYVGFTVIDRQGRQVAALLDEAVGISLDGQPLQTLERAFDGPPVVTLPRLSFATYQSIRPSLRNSSPWHNGGNLRV
jgi:hypothetical protein